MKDLDSQLQGVQTAAIAGHVRPDGDCVGSCLATDVYKRQDFMLGSCPKEQPEWK